MGNYTIFYKFLGEPDKQEILPANVPKILDRKSSSEQVSSENWRWVPPMTYVSSSP